MQDIDIKKPFLSICVTSYNRTKELIRLLDSIDSIKYSHEIEIIVSEDFSPNRTRIVEIINTFKERSRYYVKLNLNEVNLGYDRNLGKLISLADGDYLLLMSDDDAFIPNSIDAYVNYLKTHSNISVAFNPFAEGLNFKRKFNNSFFKTINNSQDLARFLNNSILFSGLTFRTSLIKNIDASNFINTFYFQVYLFLKIAVYYGVNYIDIVLVDCKNDGENGFGHNESSINSEFLKDRKSVFSMLEFHKGLFKVIDIFDDEHNSSVKVHFAKEYSIKTIGGLIRARNNGIQVFKDYLYMIESLNINLGLIYYIYKFMLICFGSRLTSFVLFYPKLLFIKFRMYIK